MSKSRAIGSGDFILWRKSKNWDLFDQNAGEIYFETMNEFSRPRIGGLYEHYKGKRYRVRAIARHSETLDEVVIYECLYKNDLGQIWARPLEMFMSEVEAEGKLIPRFRKCSID